jgi:hypothetical protein
MTGLMLAEREGLPVPWQSSHANCRDPAAGMKAENVNMPSRLQLPGQVSYEYRDGDVCARYPGHQCRAANPRDDRIAYRPGFRCDRARDGNIVDDVRGPGQARFRLAGRRRSRCDHDSVRRGAQHREHHRHRSRPGKRAVSRSPYAPGSMVSRVISRSRWFRRDGSYFGTLCGLDPKPMRLSTPAVPSTLELLAQLVSAQLEAERGTAELGEQFIAVLAMTCIHRSMTCPARWLPDRESCRLLLRTNTFAN